MIKAKASDELVFLPLGGSNEIGMNFNLYGFGPPHARKWIVVDLGVTFGGDTPKQQVNYGLSAAWLGAGIFGVMCHKDHRKAKGARTVENQTAHLVAQGSIKPRKRFVKQQRARACQKTAQKGDTGALTA